MRGSPDATFGWVLMSTKLRPPTSPPEVIERPHLVARLLSHSGPVLVSAPPGYGKSTLLSLWLQQTERPHAWVAVDPSDNDPVVLWSYIVAAIRSAEPRVEVTLPPPAASREQDIVRVVVPQLLNELEELGADLVLVLDDYHCITNAGCHASMELLLAHRPANLSLAVATRADPPLALGRALAAGELLRLGASDLEFTEGEAARFLNDALRLGLPAGAVARLQERAEGWPAGLYLAYLSLRDADDREAAVAEFHGSSRHVGDYLAEVALDAQEPATRGFLLETSILDRLFGPLCDAVTGRSGSAQLLTELERGNLFLTSLDDRRRWFRYHPLFRDLLRAELGRTAPERAIELHRRAFRWLADEATGSLDAARRVSPEGRSKRRYVDEAIRHAIAAGDPRAAGELVTAHYLPTIEWGGYATVAGWLQALPRNVVANDARLSIVEAWVMSFLLRRQEARVALQNALDAGHDGPLPDGASSLEASAALLRAGFPWGNVGDMLRAAERAFELEGMRDSMWRATVHVQLGFALALSGRFDEARPFLDRGAALASLAGQSLNELGARCILAWLDIEAGRLGAAERQARAAAETMRATGLSDTAAAGYAWATLGAVLARRGDLAKADRLLDEGVERMRRQIEPLLVIQALLALVPVRRALGFPSEARRLVTEAGTLIEECADPGILHGRFEDARRLVAIPLDDAVANLTRRELEVLRLLGTSLSQREIGRELYVSHNTVHTHVRAIYRKLGAASRREAFEIARKHGLVNGLAPKSPG
jgi:LuxR family transcriptional regulator, maltose regulon positive regulatory protein